MKRLRLFSVLSAAAAALGLTGCAQFESTGKIPAVKHFDSARYLGRWYEIARLPHSFERGMDFVSAEYSANADGTIRVVNSGRRDGVEKSVTGVAVPKGDAGIGELQVSFFRPFYGDYRIILLEPDYSAAIVTGPTMEYLWILARSPELPPDRLRSYREQISAWGFDTKRLEYPKQELKR